VVATRALLLDVNGTLSDDEPLLLRIYQRLFGRYRPAVESRD
jgi:beta-phosphoglucomutase-like phosphatase (HAD superfamily)